MTLLANINVGSSPNDGTGDSLRTSFTKCNDNFQILDTLATEFTSGNLNTNITSNGTSTFNVVVVNTSITSNLFSGNGSALTNVVAATANLSSYAAQVTGNIQANITTVGTLGNLTVAGTILTNIVEGSTIGNSGASLVGTIATASQTNITELGTLSNLSMDNGFIATTRLITYQPNNDLDTVLPSSDTVSFLPNTSTIYGAIITSNLTLGYSGTITPGVVRNFFIKNNSGSTQYVILPNSNNNKVSNSIAISANSVATFIFVPFDTTDSNVFVTVINS